MVAAGVYMLCRVSFLFVPGSDALLVIAWIGGFTALLAALIAVQQNDIKRILAYSTLSQLGYMVMAIGLASSNAAMFHLFTHAFFKALLFLGAGSVIIALHHEQDIWEMGGLSRRMKITFIASLIGALALMGAPPLSGSLSKDSILARALDSGNYSTGEAQKTLSPSMDIQVASNFERALLEASGRDANWVSQAMRDFAATRSLEIPAPVLLALKERYLASRADDDETIGTIARVYKENGIVIDPHTAVGIAAAEKLRPALEGPVVALATAHPAKFSGAVTQAIGKAAELPPHLSDLSTREERYTVLANAKRAVEEFVMERIHKT
jgi:hypothetical protein